jgi:nicotinate-nucleotide pyrophosphorylase (carboxylating)
VERVVRLALDEDVGPGDLTTRLTVPPDASAEARIVAKQDLVLSGLVPARLVFDLVDAQVRFEASLVDGDRAAVGQTIASLQGPAASILTAERVALNFLMHLSGVATLTSRFAAAIGSCKARIVDTRKTTPGLRALEKEAVRHGGGVNHRFALYDGILIKDNHIAACGSITNAVARARSGAPHTVKIEVEVQTLEQLQEAVASGADIALLDNMDVQTMTQAVALADGRVVLEASGNVTLDTVGSIAAAGVDLISSGSLTHSVSAADISLKFL